MKTLFLSTLATVGNDAGVFNPLMGPSKSFFGNLAFILLELLGWLSIAGVILSLIGIFVLPEKRKGAIIFFIVSILIAILKFGESIKLFLNNLG